MKTLGIILSVLLVILILLGVGLQMFLTKGLTAALNKGIFPAVHTMYGLEMGITNASVNVLKGTAELQGFTVRNLKGYEKPYLMRFDECRLKIDMRSLIRRDPIIIDHAEASGTTLVVERNSEKKYNVKELADALKPVESAGDKAEVEPQPAPPAAKKKQPLPIHVRRIAVDMRVLYADTKRNREIPLDLRLTASDLFTVPEKGQPDSLIVLRGSLANDENQFATDLNAIVEPLTDLKKPTFNASGSILDIDAEFLHDLLNKNDMQSGSFSLKPSISCKEGELVDSFVDVTLKDLEVYGAVIGETKLRLPLLPQFPWIDWEAALKNLFSEQSGKIIQTLGRSQLEKELGINTQAAPKDMLVQGLTNSVEEVAESPELQNLIRTVLPGSEDDSTTTTNQPLKKTLENVLIEQLEKNVKEVEGSEAIKGVLRGLFNK